MTDTAAANDEVGRHLESRHIDVIPAAERHGKPWHQFAF
jgi:hypothetical protein